MYSNDKSLEISNFYFSFTQSVHKLPAILQDILVKSNVHHNTDRNTKITQLKLNTSFHQSQNFTYWNYLYMSFQIAAHWSPCFLSPMPDLLSLPPLGALGGPQLPKGVPHCSSSEYPHRTCCVLNGLPIALSGYFLHTTEAFLMPHIQFKSSAQIYSFIESFSILAFITIYNWILSAWLFNTSLPS